MDSLLEECEVPQHVVWMRYAKGMILRVRRRHFNGSRGGQDSRTKALPTPFARVVDRTLFHHRQSAPTRNLADRSIASVAQTGVGVQDAHADAR